MESRIRVLLIAAILCSASVASANSIGYYLVGSNGSVFNYGGATFHGDLSNTDLADTVIVGIELTMDGGGYWLLGSNGAVTPFGDAIDYYYGDKRNDGLGDGTSIVGMATTADGKGYWLAGANGSVYNFGDAGAISNNLMNQGHAPIVAIRATPDGFGYWLVASDGTVYTFGDAHNFGLTGNLSGIVGMATTPDGGGYWLVGSNGQIYAYGDASPWGSPVNDSHPDIVGIEASADGLGYLLTDITGTVYAYGTVSQSGGHHDLPLPQGTNIIAIEASYGNYLYTPEPGTFPVILLTGIGAAFYLRRRSRLN